MMREKSDIGVNGMETANNLPIIKPSRLQTGDTIGIVSPSNSIQTKSALFTEAVKNFSNAFGLDVVVAPHALDRYYYSSAPVSDRVSDINKMFEDPNIKAVLFSVGGNTAIDLLPSLDYDLIRRNPKIFAGISDATTLLDAVFAKTGLVTFHGIEFLDFASQPMDYTKEQLKAVLFEGRVGNYSPNPNWKDFEDVPSRYSEQRSWRTIKEGVAEGKIVGGNLHCFESLMNTQYSPELDGNIFVMETYKWSKKVIHMHLQKLRLNGVFDKISGLIAGYCLLGDSPDAEGNERDIKDVLLEATEGYGFPIMEIGEIGHHVENLILPIGAKAKLDATNRIFSLEENPVSQ